MPFTRRRPAAPEATASTPPDVCQPIASVRARERAHVAGKVRSVRVQPWSGVASLECTIVDDTGGVGVVFLGRREIAGIHPGTLLAVEGMVGVHNRRLAMINPSYQLIAPSGPDHG